MGEYSLPKGISCLNIYSLKINELIQSPEAGVHFFSTIGVARGGGRMSTTHPRSLLCPPQNFKRAPKDAPKFLSIYVLKNKNI